MSSMNKTNIPVVALIIILVLAICLMIAWPLMIIWALNTLFITLSIPYSFWTWLAMAVLNVSTFGGLASTIKNDK